LIVFDRDSITRICKQDLLEALLTLELSNVESAKILVSEQTLNPVSYTTAKWLAI